MSVRRQVAAGLAAAALGVGPLLAPAPANAAAGPTTLPAGQYTLTAYTPVSIDPQGRVYAQNNGELYVLGS